MPGTPPNGLGGGPISHLAVLPLPVLLLTRTCTSPRSLPLGMMLFPTGMPDVPSCPSITNKTWPVACTKTWRP